MHYTDCSSQICKRYAWNMPEICLNMHIIVMCFIYAVVCIKYAQNTQIYRLIFMLLYVSNMHKICKYTDCISQLCRRYARNMLKYAVNVQLSASNMQVCAKYPGLCQKYARNMQNIDNYMDWISQICKKYAVKMQKYAVLYARYA